nr:hypothetical protein [Rhodococcus sp. (in: high G+C Gram-positive bacteria)]
MKISRKTAVVAAGIIGVLTSTAPIAMAAPSVENPQAPQAGNGAGTSLSQQEGNKPPASTPQAGPGAGGAPVPANPQATPGAVPANPQSTPGPVAPSPEGTVPAPATPGEQATPQTAAPEQGSTPNQQSQQWSPEPTAPAAPSAPEPPKEGPPFVTIDVTVFGVPELTPIALPPLPEGIVLPPPPVEVLLHQVPDGQGAPTVQVTTAPPLPEFHL